MFVLAMLLLSPVREPLEEAGAEACLGPSIWSCSQEKWLALLSIATKASLVLMTLASRLAEHLRGDQAGLQLGKKQLLKSF